MPLETELPPEIAAEVEAAEVESMRAFVDAMPPSVEDVRKDPSLSAKWLKDHPAPVPPKPRKTGRPPKGVCAACGEPLAVGRTCPCVALRPSVPPDIAIPRPAWEPLPLEDLRERLTVLAQSGVESYEDGAIKITINQQARLAGVAKSEDRRERW